MYMINAVIGILPSMLYTVINLVMVISVACTQAEYHHIISTLQFSQYDFSVAMSYFSHSPKTKCMWASVYD